MHHTKNHIVSSKKLNYYANHPVKRYAAISLDDALELFGQAVAASPESEIGKSAQKMLDKYSE